MTHVKGGWGRVVWMPTFDAENQVRYSTRRTGRSFRVSKNGELLPEVNEVLALIAKNKLTLETGHSSAEEGPACWSAQAKRAGVTSIVVTHAMMPPVGMNIEQMKQAAAHGRVHRVRLQRADRTEQGLRTSASTRRRFAPSGRSIAFLSSDLGQAGNPLHPDGLEAFFQALRGQGFSVAEIDRMAKTNPAKLLGLE